jgi:hypothetical protein
MVGREGAAPVYCATGSPSMVASLRQLLNDAGIDDDEFRSKEIFGY